MSILFVGGAIDVFALNATASPANGEYIYSVDPFGSEYSAGYLCLSKGQVSSALQTMSDNLGNTTTTQIWGNNTSKDTSIYIDYDNGATNNGVYYDVRIYYWKDNDTTQYYVTLSNGEIGTRNGSTVNNTVTAEFHFYEAGSNYTNEVSWSGVLSLQDCDLNEGYTFNSGLQYGTVWLNDPTNIVKTDTNTWRGTYENDNSGTNAEEETIWACVTGSASTPLTLTYWGAKSHGSGLNYKGASVTYVLVETSDSNIPGGAEDTLADNYYCALYGEYAPVEPGTFTRYTFSGWYLDEDLTEPVDDTIIVTGAITLYGTYYKTGGYIDTGVTHGDITDGEEDVPYGEDYTIEYEPDDGYLIDTVTVDGVEVDITEYPSSYTFYDLDDDHTIEVVYAKPSASKEVYLYSSDYSNSYTSGQSIEGYILVPGDVVEYQISYNNPTSATRTIVIKDTLSGSLSPVSASNNGTISGQTVTWTLSVAAYTSGTVSVYAEVVEGGEISNTASVTFKALSGSTTESDVTVSDTVSISAMENPIKWAANEGGEDVTDQVISAGDTLTYYIQFTNPSSETKTFTVTDEVPDGTTLISSSISSGGTYSKGVITWSGISLAGGATKTVCFSVTVDEPSNELTQIANQATVAVDNIEIDSVATTSSSDDNSTWVYVLDDPVKVAMDGDGNNLSDSQTIVTEGTYVDYEITVSNPAKSSKVFTITDPLPEYVTYVSSDNGGTYNSSTHTVTWDITVGAGESASVSVTVMVSYGSQGACFENVATVTVDSTTTETSGASLAVMTSPAKYVTINGEDADNEPVSVGDTLVYSINYYNPSEYMKTFTITDYLPNEVTFVSADQGGTYDATTHSVTWKITMYGKTYNTVYATVTVNEGTEGTAFDNHLAYIQADGAELYTNKVTNWVSKKTVASTDGTDLSGNTVSAGSTIVYTISTINTTSEDRYMQIYDNIPAGLTPVSVSDGGTINGQEVTWNVLVGAGYLKEVSVTCTVNSGYNGSLITNTATVKGIKLTANVSDAGIHIGNETISTGIAASNTPYAIIFAVAAVAAVAIGSILIVRKRRK